ncbi:acyl-homoserine-lactone synthase [Undibacterium crateris]|uniref:acyl-homoserine-lactone synthase n=1 Tax=Undibacterium crateris TaxID=2528175 RepID=UPI001F1A2F13|nr:acyl-homoserine-lactone synthase [Undibacterium crateris]
MQLNLEIAARTAFPKSELFAMQRLRAKVFSGRMGWEVPVMSGMEIDGYDAMDPYYMMMREEGGILRGSRSVHVERQLPRVPARP